MKTGDKVVCIRTSKGDFVVKNRIYIIDFAVTCGCGNELVDVGVVRVGYGGTYCEGCRCQYHGKHLFNSTYFRPIQYNTCHDELINIVEERIDIKQPEHEKV